MDDKIKTILKANHLYDKDNKKLEDFNITHNKLDEFYDTYKQNHTNKQSIPEVKRDKTCIHRPGLQNIRSLSC